ncbi:amylo-alpha-1,6-glucosidase [Planosporangium flavigriseum]|uniref:Amylo-alpha-1,6-glucosidase n=1 Tax=Planosporangium flavigriseum TaxID=373681 RepID=A0A8J3PNP8_9ACTN|nr:glycogen debranching N-terminal domain-containing protein [Planosporangium flavigriseum]NJC66185.1 amylo-alpha-1,6-glucosidase [Planosporangium flavigriseum]GIG75123.1 amylo-alpha-1,6-glucosidase [Planosporangium flavigriseum]
MTETQPIPIDGATATPAVTGLRQPYLHEHVTCLCAPVLWASPRQGDLLGGVDGLYVADRRVLARLRVTVAGEAPSPISTGSTSPADARFLAVVRGLGDPRPDPTVTCERRRHVGADAGTETIRVDNSSHSPIVAEIAVHAGTDLAPIGRVKAGEQCALLPAVEVGSGLGWTAEDGTCATLVAYPPPQVDARAGRLRWRVEIAAGASWTAKLTARLRGRPAPAAPADPADPADPAAAVDTARRDGFWPMRPAGPAPWHADPLRIRAADHRADQLVRRSVADLDALRLCDPADAGDSYFAAGSPWYLTLFGRDALWSALMSLPLGYEMLAGTLRTLARRQGTRVDHEREEAPGKILHEVRPADAAYWLPPVYYGTVDATPLFVVALAEAWRWGMPADEVGPLVPAAARALEWLSSHGDPDGDGLIEYVPTGTALINQGWKDSSDGVQWANGEMADSPLALAEVQGYAYRAAVDGAALLDAYGHPDADKWRQWAADLAARFRDRYWLPDRDGMYPAIALDGRKRAVDGPASNMGHLVGTGILSADEEAIVARRLGSPSLSSGYGVRTLADSAAGFNPLSYHAGSVWPHDTAIAAMGLGRAGLGRQAADLLTGLIVAAPSFDYRLPELYGGERATPPLPPVPYPASCRPQAWAAAVGPSLARVLLGIDADIPAGRITLSPVTPSPVGAFEVHGVRIGGGCLAARVDAQGRTTVLQAPPGIEVVVR